MWATQCAWWVCGVIVAKLSCGIKLWSFASITLKNIKFFEICMNTSTIILSLSCHSVVDVFTVRGTFRICWFWHPLWTEAVATPARTCKDLCFCVLPAPCAIILRQVKERPQYGWWWAYWLWTISNGNMKKKISCPTAFHLALPENSSLPAVNHLDLLGFGHNLGHYLWLHRTSGLSPEGLVCWSCLLL